ncbi:MAG: SDR family oxidoreductase [Proteobacteria bacterium]|nr:SDR family oxidoreductase [Pseudomonadota bacterium]
MGLLEGKVAVVSGIGPGLGRGIALALAGQGADVALGARRENVLAEVAGEVEALGRRAVWKSTDVSNDADCRELVERAGGELGGVDIVVNSAAAFGDGRSVMEGDFENWRGALDVSVMGALQLTRAALPLLAARGDGRVVNIGTMATRDIQPREGAYAATKAALLSATKTLARELGPRGIRVNAVNPGYIDGGSIREYFERQAREGGGEPDDYARAVIDQIPLGYIPPPEEIAGSVVFLASDLSRPVTGHVLDCNGGMWM